MRTITRHIRDERLKNGIRLIVDEFGTSGTVSLAVSFAGGKNHEKRPLIAACTAFMLGEGTRRRSKRTIQMYLDAMGASRSYEGLGDRIEATGKARVSHLYDILALLAEELREPRFGAKELRLLKKRTAGLLEREEQDTKRRAEIGLARALYEKGHPNHEREIGELRKALSAISREHLIEHHARCVGTRELVIVVSGSVSFRQVRKTVERAFSGLPPGMALQRRTLKAAKRRRTTVLIPVAHKTNIDYLAGIRLGIGNEHPDFEALLVGARVLGNPGFTGRLMKTVREQEGLTYVAYSYLKGFGDFSDGHLMVWSAFAPELFRNGRESVVREIRKLALRGVTARELAVHKRIVADGWLVRFSNTSARASAILDVVHDGLPLSYLDSFPERIGRLTRSQVNEALKRYIRPDLLTEVAAGPVDSVTLKP